MFHLRSALCASLGLWIFALSGPARALCQSERASIERQYRRLDSAVARNDVTAILAFQSPAFTSINPNGAVFEYQAMEARTRLLSSLVDSVIYVRNTIRDFAGHGDTVVVTVCQEFSRIQRIDGRPRRVDTSVLRRERWAPVGTEWKRERVDDVHGTRWFVDGVRVDAVRPYSSGAPPYAPNPDPPTGCGRL
jgi:hypothetical protein